MTKHRTLFLTQRGLHHQRRALEAAPPALDVIMRRDASREELVDLLGDVEFLITERSGVIDAEMIAVGQGLRLIQRLGRQVWDIDLDAARRAGIAVCAWPIMGCALVAEHMIMQMLGLLKRVREMMIVVADADDWGIPSRRCDEDWFAYNWSKRAGIGQLMGATVGVLGFGEIGLELAKRLSGFDCTVLYHKRQRLPQRVEAEYAIHYASPDEIAAESDVVCCLLPYPGSEGAMNAAYFAKMKPGAIFVHAGSGAVVDEPDLIDALRSGHLSGAALDTYTYEPMRADDPLLALARDPAANLILTPHTAAGGISTRPSGGRADDYANIVAMIKGRPLRYEVV
jgi:phosphoglycerate dehydrogenase-like enzyme